MCGGWPILLEPLFISIYTSASSQWCPKTSSVLPHSALCSPFELAHFHPQTNMVRWCHVSKWLPMLCTLLSVPLQDILRWSYTPINIILAVYISWQQKMCFVWEPDMIQKVRNVFHRVTKPSTHGYSCFHVRLCKLLLYLDLVRIQIKIWFKNTPQRLSRDS